MRQPQITDKAYSKNAYLQNCTNPESAFSLMPKVQRKKAVHKAIMKIKITFCTAKIIPAE